MAGKNRTRKPAATAPVVHDGDMVRLEESSGKLLEAKLILVGNSNAGKSMLTERLVQSKEPPTKGYLISHESDQPGAFTNVVAAMHQSMLTHFEQYKGAIHKVIRLHPEAGVLHYVVALSDSGSLDIETELYGHADELAYRNGDLIAIQMQFVRPDLIDRFQPATVILG